MAKHKNRIETLAATESACADDEYDHIVRDDAESDADKYEVVGS